MHRIFAWIASFFCSLFLFSLAQPVLATDPFCPTDPLYHPSFSITSAECNNGGCDDLLLYALPERTLVTQEGPRRLLMPAAECSIGHQYAISATLRPNASISFTVSHKVNGLSLGIAPLFVNGVEQFAYTIPYSEQSQYEIRDGETIIVLVPTVENETVTALDIRCATGLCEDLVVEKDPKIFRYTASYVEHEASIQCAVFLVETDFNACSADHYTTIVDGTTPNRGFYGFGHGNDDALIRTRAMTLYPLRTAIEVNALGYTFTIHAQNRWMYHEIAAIVVVLASVCGIAYLVLRMLKKRASQQASSKKPLE